MGRVSAVMPIYNVERYLPECLESVARQRVDLEVIMIDDGSTDRSGEIAERFAARDRRFRLVRQANGGQAHARNQGVELATGDFLAFVDSDDLLAPNAYEMLLGALQQTGSDFAAGNIDRIYADGRAPYARVAKAFAKDRLETHVTRFPPLLADRTPWNKLFRRSFWDEHALRFPEGVRNEDIAVMLPAHVLARSVDVLADVVYVYRVRTEGPASGTQRRFERHAIAARLAAMQHVRDFLSERGLHKVRRRYDESVLVDDLRLYMEGLEAVDGETREYCLDCIDAFLERGTPGVLDGLPPLQRLEWHLMGRRLLPELFELLRFERDGPAGARPLRVGWRWYADYPFREDPRLDIPASVYAYHPSYVVRRVLEGDRRRALHAAGRAVRGLVGSRSVPGDRGSADAA